jgi:hypothetical protein
VDSGSLQTRSCSTSPQGKESGMRPRKRCQHGRYRFQCVDCGGISICEHRRQRSRCRDCKGNSFCEHERQRSTCKECEGSEICGHRRRRSVCVDCKGGAVCEHDRQRYNCSICNPRGAFRGYERSSLKRDLTFELSLDDFKTLVAQPCLYCGDCSRPRGIDRWDNEIGYTADNSRPCCWSCNELKGAVSGPTFLELIQRIADHRRLVERTDSQEAIFSSLSPCMPFPPAPVLPSSAVERV